jgi:hypothetical protein
LLQLLYPLQVFAGLRFHPGVNLLHSAAQHVTSKVQQATAAAAAYRLPITTVTELLQVGLKPWGLG